MEKDLFWYARKHQIGTDNARYKNAMTTMLQAKYFRGSARGIFPNYWI